MLNAAKPKEPTDGQLVAITNPATKHTSYARTEDTSLGRVYHELWLDLSQRPHDTGRTITPGARDLLQPVELWDDTPTEPAPAQATQQEAAERPPALPPAIIGPKTAAYPRNVGWHMKHQTPYTDSKVPRKLSDLTIHNVTQYLTSFITANAQPSCVVNWPKKLGQPIPLATVFASFGTPLSDPTEERQWRKLVHRATFVRNRDPNGPQQCWLCGTHVERILHLFECEQTAPYWRTCIAFCVQVLGVKRPANIRNAVIFGIDGPTTLLPEEARAFLRHAYNRFYHDFANVDVKLVPFHPVVTYAHALRSFRDAVYRYGMQLRVLYNTRRYSTLEGTAPEEARKRYPRLITIGAEGGFALSDALSNTVDQALKRATDALDRNRAQQTHRNARPQ